MSELPNISKATDLIHQAQEAYQQRDWWLNHLDEATHRRDFIAMEHTRRRAFEYRDEYYRLLNEWEAETGRKWRVSLLDFPPPDGIMDAAFAALANDLAYQDLELLQEIADVWDVWEYIKEHGGGITRPSVIVFPVDEVSETKFFERFADGRTNANVAAAAEWVRKQSEP